MTVFRWLYINYEEEVGFMKIVVEFSVEGDQSCPKTVIVSDMTVTPEEFRSGVRKVGVLDSESAVRTYIAGAIRQGVLDFADALQSGAATIEMHELFNYRTI
jgi:hypothetical protein